MRLIDDSGQLDAQTISAFILACENNTVTQEDILVFVTKLDMKSVKPVLD